MLEGALRIAGFPRGIVRSFSGLWSVDPGKTVGLFRPGRHRIGFPTNLAYDVTINDLGLRGPPLTIEKEAGVTRILALGDSITFGYYTDDEDTYPALLHARLKAAGHAVEVVNAGCGHFSIHDERAYFEERLLRLKPDVVVLQFCGNDVNPRELARDPLLYHSILSGEESKVNWLRQSAIGEAQLLLALRLKQWSRERAGTWPPTQMDVDGPEISESSWIEYRRGLQALKELCARHGISLVLTSFADLQSVENSTAPPASEDRLMALAAAAGITYRGTWEVLSREPDPRGLYHWPYDPHPSARGNAAFAGAVHALLETEGLLSREVR